MSVMSDTPDILQKSWPARAEEIAERQQRLSLRELRRQTANLPAPRPFQDQLTRTIAAGRAAVIAEIKRASPSKGLLRDPFEPAAIAQSYAAAGAACLSVLTDRDFFQGHEDYLRAAQGRLRPADAAQGFHRRPYQVHEARLIGADCILLIVAALDDATWANWRDWRRNSAWTCWWKSTTRRNWNGRWPPARP